MQRVVGSGELVYGEHYVRVDEATAQPEDDLGFAAALKLAIPAGLSLWGAALWAAIRLFS